MASRYWGEEFENGAIYSVFLRKVAYHSPRIGLGLFGDPTHSGMDVMDSSNGISHLQWETLKERIIKAGTVKKLLECLIVPVSIDPGPTNDSHSNISGLSGALSGAVGSGGAHLDTKHFQIFFNTYRSFAGATEVLNSLLEIYNDHLPRRLSSDDIIGGDGGEQLSKLTFGSGTNSAHKMSSSDKSGGSHHYHDASANPPQANLRPELLALRSAIYLWLEFFPEDFTESPPNSDCLRLLLDFCTLNMPALTDLHSRAVKLRRKAHARRGSDRKSYKHNKIGLIATAEDLDYFIDGQQHNRLADFATLEARYIADQLTYHDAELFKALVPYQCLGSMWNKRSRSADDFDRVYSVRATVNQFNAIVFRTITQILRVDAELTSINHQGRARIIAKWIEVLKELRIRKNYSSLKAIMSALSVEPVHRLKSVWNHVPKGKVEELNALNKIFSEEQNYLGTTTAKDVIDKQLRNSSSKSDLDILGRNGVGANGTIEDTGGQPAANDNSLNSKAHSAGKRNKCYHRTKSDVGEIQGTVPYLGNFLTDLTHIDEALPTRTRDGFINFDKCRKEFQILAQIKLFQATANNYHITPDLKFRAWFSALPCMDKPSDWDDCSYQIEPPSKGPTPDQKKLGRRKKSKSFGSLGSLGSITQLIADMASFNYSSGADSRSHSPKTPLTGGISGSRSSNPMLLSNTPKPNNDSNPTIVSSTPPLIGATGASRSVSHQGLLRGPSPGSQSLGANHLNNHINQKQSSQNTTSTTRYFNNWGGNSGRGSYSNTATQFTPFGTCHYVPGRYSENEFDASAFGFWIGKGGGKGSNDTKSSKSRSRESSGGQDSRKRNKGGRRDRKYSSPSSYSRSATAVKGSMTFDSISDTYITAPQTTATRGGRRSSEGHKNRINSGANGCNQPTAINVKNTAHPPIPPSANANIAVANHLGLTKEYEIENLRGKYDSNSRVTNSAINSAKANRDSYFHPTPGVMGVRFSTDSVESIRSASSVTTTSSATRSLVRSRPNNGHDFFETPEFGNSRPTSTIFSDSQSDLANLTNSGQDYRRKPPTAAADIDQQDCFVVRVSLDPDLQNSDRTRTNMYKCIKLENSDKTQNLIAKALEKHEINGIPSDYCLVQLLDCDKDQAKIGGGGLGFFARGDHTHHNSQTSNRSGKGGGHPNEIVLPDRENAYYAVRPTNNYRIIHCVLRRKQEGGSYPGAPPHPPTTVREMKRKKKFLLSSGVGGSTEKISGLPRWNSSLYL